MFESNDYLQIYIIFFILKKLYKYDLNVGKEICRPSILVEYSYHKRKILSNQLSGKWHDSTILRSNVFLTKISDYKIVPTS